MNQFITAGVIIALAFLLSIFIVSMYIRGFRNGMQVAKGKEPEQIKGPINEILEHKRRKETQTQQDAINEGWQNIFEYDGTPQKGGDV